MKQCILFLAVIMLLKPLWPIAEYIINYDYIVENLCENKDRPMLNCNGKCFLAKQLAKESGEKEKNPFDSDSSEQKLPIIDWFHQQTLIPVYFDFAVQDYKNNHGIKSNLFSLEVFQPPEQL